MNPDAAYRKTCACCGLKKPLTGFYRHPATRDGYQSYCRACLKAKQKERHAAALAERAWHGGVAWWDRAPCTDAEYAEEMRKRRERPKRVCPECGLPMRRTSEMEVCESCHRGRSREGGRMTLDPAWNPSPEEARKRMIKTTPGGCLSARQRRTKVGLMILAIDELERTDGMTEGLGRGVPLEAAEEWHEAKASKERMRRVSFRVLKGDD